MRQSGQIEQLLLKHEAEVRCIRWIEPDSTLLSASADGSAIIWRVDNQSGIFEPLSILCQNTRSRFIVADATLLDDGTILTVTSDTDCSISVFKNDKMLLLHPLKKYVFDVRIIRSESFWQTASPFIAYSTDDKLVTLCLFEEQRLKTTAILSGHEDWSRSLDYKFTQNDCMLLGSASQDGFVRIWRIKKQQEHPEGVQIGEQQIHLNSCCFTISLETVLAGHEAPVYGFRFVSETKVLTSSLDKAAIVWTVGDDELWTSITRVGEIGGDNMGFMGCTFPKQTDETFDTFACFSYNGSLLIWKQNEETGTFDACPGFSGHSGSVCDISWEPDGNYLLSVSADETTRLHTKCRVDGSIRWREIARPQIHGYEMNCISSIDGYTFVSGADEKVLRVFRATKSFVNSFKALTSSEPDLKSNTSLEELPVGSVAPALGLTNRAVCDGDTDVPSIFQTTSSELLPTEETLMRDTLWPEIHKLYGHGNELYAVAVNHKKTLIVSACKSAKAEHAALIYWNINDDFRITQKLPGHQLTVTSIKFSPSDKYLLSVSRDRTWYLYVEEEADRFSQISCSDKKTCVHSRIIWDAAWTPDNRFFLTCSRDKKVIFWQLNDGQDGSVSVLPLMEHILTLDHSVTSCDIIDRLVSGSYLVALGLEDGSVLLYTFTVSDGWKTVSLKNSFLLKHHLPVRKVRFRPTDHDYEHVTLGSCSDDRTVQIFTISL